MAGTTKYSLQDKNIVVTGAAMGIGFGIAHRFAECGANVLLADINETALSSSLSRLSGFPGRATAIAIDVASDGAPAALVAKMKMEYGNTDALINNAGIYPSVPMLEMSRATWDRIHRLNLRAPAFLSQDFARQMKTQPEGGVILNIGSVDSLHPSQVGLAAYDASKAGLLMLSRSFALEMAPHRIRVNAILPGPIRTEGTMHPLEGSGMTEAEMKEMIKEIVDHRVPLKRIGMPQDVASAAAFLVSDDASYITGVHLVIDGGFLLS